MTTADAVTWLFVPGDRAGRFAKAARGGADEVICDLEDAVPEAAKEVARRQVAGWLAEGGAAWVRVNARVSLHYEADIAAVAGLAGLRGVVVPKAEDPEALAALGRRLGPSAGIVALIETALGVQHAAGIARCAAVSRLAFGSLDFAADIDAALDDQALLLARSTLVIASRAAGKPAPIDGVTTALDRPEAAGADAGRARRLGFGGKLCIHPAQLIPVARAFAPTEAEIRWAREIIEAAGRAAGAGALRGAGQMIDKPVTDRAQRILARADSARADSARAVDSSRADGRTEG